jgi:hypothetical protein
MSGTRPHGWSHPSIRALNVDDPVEWVTAQARQLAFRAMEQGWNGPPFDPAQLADMLRIEVRPSQAVLDARLVPDSRGVRIEFNPNRPAGRIRYSVAHEIGHTLFPDHAAEARHRLTGVREGADRELEMLCNMAAAEILMPIGSFTDAGREAASIDGALDLRAKFDLSMEAVLLRMGRLSRHPTTVFAAAPIGRTAAEGYRLDYAVTQGMSQLSLSRGQRLPRGSVVEECTAIGFTAKGREQWQAGGRDMSVEAIGLPPYPGDPLPRVAGLLLAPSGSGPLPSVSYLVGDATEPRGTESRIVIHVVNDATPRWGGAFARAVRDRWPHVQSEFIAWADKDRLRLGNVHIADVSTGVAVASMVAQHGYGKSSKPRIRYQALEACLQLVATEARTRGASVHGPRIGAGEAGGRWQVIAELLDRMLVQQGVPVTIYDISSGRRGTFETYEPVQMPLAMA